LDKWKIQIYRGILTGLNEAFVINEAKRDEIIKRDPKSAELIRPILRGKDIRRYTYKNPHLFLICTFPSKNIDINNYSVIREELLSFGKEKLEQSGKTYLINGAIVHSRKKTNNDWFETQDSINYWDEFYKQKIIYPCIMRDGPHFALDKAGNYFTPAPGNIITGENLEFLLGCLCSKTYYFVLRRFYMGGGIEGELKTNRLLMLPVVPFRNESDFIVIVNSVKEIYQRIQAGVSFEHEIISIEQHVQNIIGLSDDEKNYINMYKFD
jgi:hypothetical protein